MNKCSHHRQMVDCVTYQPQCEKATLSTTWQWWLRILATDPVATIARWWTASRINLNAKRPRRSTTWQWWLRILATHPGYAFCLRILATHPVATIARWWTASRISLNAKRPRCSTTWQWWLRSGGYAGATSVHLDNGTRVACLLWEHTTYIPKGI